MEASVMAIAGANSLSDSVRELCVHEYVEPARRRGLHAFEINVGEVHRRLAFKNRVPLVCMALKSSKFWGANGLRLVAETGPRSGLSTTVTYRYEFVDNSLARSKHDDPWTQLRGALKEIFAELDGGAAYLRKERASFHSKETR